LNPAWLNRCETRAASPEGSRAQVQSLLRRAPVGRTLFSVMMEDHEVLKRELAQCLAGRDVALASFDRFRHHLLWHVSIEERLLMPALVKAMRRAPDYAAGLRKDHAGIAALCIPLPEREWVENLRDLLEEHYRIEEGPGGFYELCRTNIPAEEQARLVSAIEAFPPLTLGAFSKGPTVRTQLKDVLKLVGIDPPTRTPK